MESNASIADILAEIRHRRLRYAAIALLITACAIVWAFVMRPVFRSEATVAIETSSNQSNSAMSGLGGLAALAGLSFGSENRHAEIIATLKARGTAENFIRQAGIAGQLLDATWDPVTRSWRTRSGGRRVTVADAYDVWHKRVLSVDVNHDTGLVNVSIDWFDPHTAEKWDALFLRFTDSQLRDDALRESNASINYLESQLNLTQEVEVRRSIAELVEQQLKTAMLAKVREWYSLRVIDPPYVPTKKYRPNRALIVLLGLVLSGSAVLLVSTASCLLASTARGSCSVGTYAKATVSHDA